MTKMDQRVRSLERNAYAGIAAATARTQDADIGRACEYWKDWRNWIAWCLWRVGMRRNTHAALLRPAKWTDRDAAVTGDEFRPSWRERG